MLFNYGIWAADLGSDESQLTSALLPPLYKNSLRSNAELGYAQPTDRHEGREAVGLIEVHSAALAACESTLARRY